MEFWRGRLKTCADVLLIFTLPWMGRVGAERRGGVKIGEAENFTPTRRASPGDLPPLGGGD
jgi:hypothetical protein